VKRGNYCDLFFATTEPIVGLSNCPLDVMNPCDGYHCTPVTIEVYTVA
jgi:uncharacterized protein YcgI (DUF1989 family)